MARIRTLKPEFFKHEDLSALPAETHLLAAALLNYADDEGYFNANPALIRAECCPLREDSAKVPESLRSLQSVGYLSLGRGDNGRAYGRIVNFTAHQRVSHPTKSKISELSITWEPLASPPENFRKPPEPLRPEGKGTGKGTGNREGNTTAASRPAREAPAEFEELRSIYPRRAGNQPWARARKAANARLREGHTWDEILEGARRYAVFCRGSGKEHTETVMQAATFCGPDKPFLQSWDMPARAADVRLASNLDAAAEFKRRTSR